MGPEDQAAVDRSDDRESWASVEDATRDAVEAARATGTITPMDAGSVATLMRMAERMDDPDFPYIEGRFDNVTEGLYTKLAHELGLTPAGRSRLPERVEAPKGKLGQLRLAEGSRRAAAS